MRINIIISSLIIFGVILFQTAANAGLMEVSASYGIRTSSIDKDNYSKSESWTGSYAWYFFALSAIEFSYTKGLSTQSLKSLSDPTASIYYTDFEMYGADLVITLAEKTSVLQPFVRGGMAKLKKNFTRDDGTQYGKPVDDVVPSYGFGLKINLTQTFSIKGSYDRWRSGSSDTSTTWDDAVKGGVSWMF